MRTPFRGASLAERDWKRLYPSHSKKDTRRCPFCYGWGTGILNPSSRRAAALGGKLLPTPHNRAASRQLAPGFSAPYISQKEKVARCASFRYRDTRLRRGFARSSPGKRACRSPSGECEPHSAALRLRNGIGRDCTPAIAKRTPVGVLFAMAGVQGFEPRKCQSQSLMPYRLAIPQWLFIQRMTL